MIFNKLNIKVFVLGCALAAVSCTQNYEEFNTNPSEATDDQMQADAYKIKAAMNGMQGAIIPVAEHGYQFVEALIGGPFGGYLASSNSGWNAKFETYNPPADWVEKSFKEAHNNVYKNQTMLYAATEDPVIRAVGDIVRVAAIVRVSDIFGPIPYSKVGLDGKLSAPYDSQKEVYYKMFSELDAAIAVLTPNLTSTFSSKADKIYSGNVRKWIKFANSMKLRMAMRIVYADPDKAKLEAESAVTHEVGVIASNDDNATIETAKHPLVIIMQEWGDTRIGADITKYMNGYADPRREKYFKQSTFTAGSITNGYYGLRIGVDGAPSGAALYSNVNFDPKTDTKIMLLNAAETAFLRAEGALRGWSMGGDAKSLYEEGIRLSFAQWGVSAADTYMANSTLTPGAYDDPQGTYSHAGLLSEITIAWSGADTFEKNLERIITQKWIANFPMGQEAWAEFRRTGYPKLMASPSNKSGGIVNDALRARRVAYPQIEYGENSANMPDALVKLAGPDNMATRVWWDCKK